MRDDLLLLTEDTLTDLTNVGTVRRARREMSGAITASVDESPDGTVTVTFSDEVITTITASFDTWLCTCPAATACRHLVRAVFAYQEANSAGTPPPADAGVTTQVSESTAGVPHGDSGDSGGSAADADLLTRVEAMMTPRAARAARSKAAAGIVARVALGSKPVVHLYYPATSTVRFLQGDDPRYVRCDCQIQLGCEHVAIAAFALAAAPHGGLVSTGSDEVTVPRTFTAALTDWVDALLDSGMTVAAELLPELLRLATSARAAQLHTVGAALDDLAQECERSIAQETHYSPQRVWQLLGEITLRLQAISGPQQHIPHRLVAGVKAPQSTLAQTRLVGLGAEFTTTAGLSTLEVFLADVRSGARYRIVRSRADSDTDTVTPDQLGRVSVAAAALERWAAGQATVLAAKRAGEDLSFGRSNPRVLAASADVFDDAFAPFVAHSVGDLAAVESAVPFAVSDRRRADPIAVLRVYRTGAPARDDVRRVVHCAGTDPAGAPVSIEFGYTGRQVGQAAATASALATRELRFVAGRWRLREGVAVVAPTALYFSDGVFLPHLAAAAAEADIAFDGGTTTPWALVWREVDEAAGRLLTLGLRRAGARATADLQAAATTARTAGALRVAQVLQEAASAVRPGHGWAALRNLLELDAVRR